MAAFSHQLPSHSFLFECFCGDFLDLCHDDPPSDLLEDISALGTLSNRGRVTFHHVLLRSTTDTAITFCSTQKGTEQCFSRTLLRQRWEATLEQRYMRYTLVKMNDNVTVLTERIGALRVDT